MKVLITGATGFLGSHLAIHLNRQGHQVSCLRRSNSFLPEQLAGLQTWAVDDAAQGLRKALNECRPEVVVHLAAHYVAEHGPDDIAPLLRANVEYGTQLLEAMREAGCTTMVYAGTSWQHYRGEAYRPTNLYAATKQAFSTLAEYYLDACRFRLVELHLYDSYGENDPRNKLVNLIRRAAQTGGVINMSGGQQKLHLVHIDDLVTGFEIACRLSKDISPGTRRVYRLPSQHEITIRELVERFSSLSNSVNFTINWGRRPYRHREIFELWESAEVLPGWHPKIDLDEGLKRLLDQAAFYENPDFEKTTL